MNLERRLQDSLRNNIDWLIGRGYVLCREGDLLLLSRGTRRVLVSGGRLAVIGRGGAQ
ncbi:hypothetical protein LJR071_003526 [Pseudomonas sp. LjRoot71]|uniref:hypothetical protein n=1 Tax=Pseudomonas sp. LjRoot71 TaxID=3342336 RepID=UPI003ECC7A5F